MEIQQGFIPKQQVTTNLSLELWRLAKQNFIKFNRALEVGIYSELVSSKIMDISDLPTNYNYFTKEIARLKKDKVELMTELTELKGEEKSEEDGKEINNLSE